MSVKNIQKHHQIAFTGYHEPQVKSAVNTIVKNSQKFDIVVDGVPKKERGLIHYQPNLRGCDKNDLHVYSLIVAGNLINAKNLVKVKTPLGVQVDLLPRHA